MNGLILRERTPVWFMVYGVYVYFRSTSLRNASKILEPWIRRSHVALWFWVQRFASLADRFRVKRREVQCFLVDETVVQVGSEEAWLWVAVDPFSGKFLALELSKMVNSLVAWRFLAGLRRRYGRKPLYTDGATHYPLAARWARLPHSVYGDDLKAVMERHIQTIKDRTECFDDYFPCMEEDCDHAHVHNWLNLYALIHNHIHIPSEQLNQTLIALEDMEAEKFQKIISKSLT